jgi:23S rRNA pseudouridine2605 synthase
MRIGILTDQIAVDAQPVGAARKVYLMLNKPRGLVTTTNDEKGRATVYRCLEGASLPWVFPVGRLDKASEGLLLLTNDTRWAAHVTEPAGHVEKTYHVQVRGIVDDATLARLVDGVDDEGGRLAASHAGLLRKGERNCWLELKLNEGKNRHIRRMLASLDIEVLRLVRVAVGSLELGDLKKGEYRHLTVNEYRQLGRIQ